MRKKPLQFLSPIHKASRQIGVYLEAYCQDRGVAPREGHLVSYLAKFPSRVSELQRVFGIKPSTLTSMLDRLENRELIQRTVDPEDRRSFLISLTPSGEDLAEEISTHVAGFEKTVRKRISTAELDGFNAVMKAIGDVTDVELRSEE